MRQLPLEGGFLWGQKNTIKKDFLFLFELPQLLLRQSLCCCMQLLHVGPHTGPQKFEVERDRKRCFECIDSCFHLAHVQFFLKRREKRNKPLLIHLNLQIYLILLILCFNSFILFWSSKKLQMGFGCTDSFDIFTSSWKGGKRGNKRRF